MRKQEERLQSAIARYIRVQYPNVVFTSESSGIRVPMGLAVQMKAQRSKHKLPDLIILETNEKFSGLMIELKNDRQAIYKKDGTFRKSEHVEAQRDTLRLLKSQGYMAVFGCGFEETKNIIDYYMSLAKIK
jgi:hypothetical protein